jgi:hypothetical protein
MDLGVRQIRSSGRGSGSIELTLPAGLRDLVGLPCRILLRDGNRPDIVVQPDFCPAEQAFSRIWRAMAAALLCDEAEAPALPLAAFTFGLNPRIGGGDVPFLCWRDGLMLAAAPPHEPEAVSRTLAALGQVMADPLRIDPALALAFGVACGHLVAGVPPGSGRSESCDIAAAAMRFDYTSANALVGAAMQAPMTSQLACAAGVADPAFWRHAIPKLTAIADLFADWTADPSSHAALRGIRSSSHANGTNAI